jgi:hypothetical protein
MATPVIAVRSNAATGQENSQSKAARVEALKGNTKNLRRKTKIIDQCIGVNIKIRLKKSPHPRPEN